MTVEFTALVDLVRRSREKACENGELSLCVDAGVETDRHINAIHNWLAPTVYVGGREHFKVTEKLPSGTEVKLVYRPVTGGNRAVFGSLADLLEFQYGRHQYAPPSEYFLLDENYASGEIPDATSALASFQRVPELLQLLDTVKDVKFDESPPVYVFLAEGRIDIAIAYDEADLGHLPSKEFLLDFAAELNAAPLIDAKKRILKRIFKRFLESAAPERRFGQLMRTLGAIRDTFDADFALYESEFNFEKLREEFEHKRVDYMLKLNSAATDAMSKLLAIPVAQGLLVTQMKSGALLANVALILASMVFAIIAGLILKTQYDSVWQIDAEITGEVKNLKDRYPDQYMRLESSYRALRARAERMGKMPWWLGAILVILTLFTLFCFWRISHSA